MKWLLNPFIPEEMSFKKILEIVSYSRHLYYPVVNREENRVGIISFSDIRDAAQKEDMEETTLVRDLATPDAMTLKPNHNREILVNGLKI